MSKGLLEERLVVKWQIPDPPLPASSWKVWDKALALADNPLEIKLNWPRGTLSVLDQAFHQQLPRTYGWDLSAQTEPEAFRQAARVFRRGVALKEGKPSAFREGVYPIHLTSQWDLLRIAPSSSLTFIDRHVMESWKIPPSDRLVPLELNEATKNLETVAQVLALSRDIESSLSLSEPWTVIGGGILADTVAFAAALAGREFRLVPTTLLAMLDACVGGKTGVNFPPYGKNQLGLFAFPSEVLVSIAWLQTLSQRELLAGMCEGFKHALLIGDPLLAKSIAHLDKNPGDLKHHLKQLVQLKVDTVMKDPSEQGVRATLNLGHTLAHALERISHQRRGEHPLLHGEAVGIGLLFCLELSHQLSHLPSAPYEAMSRLLLESRLVVKPKQLLKYLGFADLNSNELIEELLIGIKQDKKARSTDGSEWILLEDWGKVVESKNRFTVHLLDDDFRTIYRRFIDKWNS